MTDPLPGRAWPAGRCVVPAWTRLAAVLLLACPTWSAEDAQDDGRRTVGLLEEVVTTATKKSQAEAARDVPVAVWVKPAKATKTAKSHRVPLSRQALQLLVKARQGNRDALVFPGAPGGDAGQFGDGAGAAHVRDRGVGPRVPVELQGLGAAARRGRATLGVRAGACRGLRDGSRLRARRSAREAPVGHAAVGRLHFIGLHPNVSGSHKRRSSRE